MCIFCMQHPFAHVTHIYTHAFVLECREIELPMLDLVRCQSLETIRGVQDHVCSRLWPFDEDGFLYTLYGMSLTSAAKAILLSVNL